MTTCESMMLAICFGATMGWLIACVLNILFYWFSSVKKKFKARKEKNLSNSEASTTDTTKE